MPNGYYLPYVAEADERYWNYGFGRIHQKPDGTISKGGILYLRRPPDQLGTHQSAYLDGVGRVIVKIGGFRPAPANVSNGLAVAEGGLKTSSLRSPVCRYRDLALPHGLFFSVLQIKDFFDSTLV